MKRCVRAERLPKSKLIIRRAARCAVDVWECASIFFGPCVCVWPPTQLIMTSRTSWRALIASILPSFAVSAFARRRAAPSAPRPRVGLQRSVDGLPPVVAQTFPEQYESLLAVKVSQLEGLLAEATGAVLPPTEVFESEREHFRMRANFKLWREEDEVHYVMYERDAPARCRSRCLTTRWDPHGSAS